MRWGRIKEFWERGWISFGIIAAAFFYFLTISWQKWGDLIVDTGREMYVPADLALGGLLYRDIFYLYGPFSPYFHAGLYKLIGIHLGSLVFSGMLTTALTTLLIFKISRIFLNRFFSTLTCLIFLPVFAFGHHLFLANYNFIMPYSYPAIHGMMFSLAALYCFFRFVDNKSLKISLYMCGIFVFFVLITRVEMGLMLILSMMTGSCFLKLSKKDTDFQWSFLMFFCGFPLLISGFVYSIMFSAAGDMILESKLFSFASTNTFMDNPFTSWLSGTDDLTQNIMTVLKSFFFYLILAFWFVVGGFLAEKARAVKKTVFRRGSYVVLSIVFLGAAFVFLKAFFPHEMQYRCLPLALILLAGVLFCPLRPQYFYQSTQLLILTLFSFLVLLRIVLNVHPMHYGFSLLVPGLIVYHIILFGIIPKIFRKEFIRLGWLIGFTCVVLFFAFQYTSVSHMAYSRRNFKVSSDIGSMKVFKDDKGVLCGLLIQFLSQETPPDSTVVVLPEGLTINFLARRANPLYYYSYMPPDFYKQGVEQEVIFDIHRRRVDYIVLLQRGLEEYGMHTFGVDYAQWLWRYIQQYYRLETQLGPFPYTTPQFGVAVFKRIP